MDQNVLVVWICLALAVIAIILFIRRRQNKHIKPELSEYLSLALAVLGVISSGQLLYKAFTLKQLQDLLGADLVTLVIGGASVVWVSIKEILRSLE